MNREVLRRKFEEMLQAYRNTPNLTGHRIVEENYPEYKVQSSDSGNIYTVNIQNFSCTCRGYRNWGRCKHILFIIKQILERNISIPEGQIQQTYYDISRYIQSYHGGATGDSRVGTIPIVGVRTYGIEIEVKFQNYTTYLGDINFDLLIYSGAVVERDGSVDLEFKSPILSGKGLLQFALNPFWKRIESLQDPDYKKQGIHIHIGWDSLFDVGKRPNSSTLEFLNRAGEYLENLFDFEKVFGRRPNSYCKRIADEPDPYNRYRWLNLRPLRRPVGKTLEIRGFFSKPTRLLRYLFTAKFISLYLERALIRWRVEGRPDEFDFSPERILGEKELEYFKLALIKEWPAKKVKRLAIVLDGLGVSIKDYKAVKQFYELMNKQ